MLPEEPPVRDSSISASVGGGYSCSDGLFLNPGEGGCPECDIGVQVLNGFHCRFIYGHDRDYRRQILSGFIILFNPRHKSAPQACIGLVPDLAVSFLDISPILRPFFPHCGFGLAWSVSGGL